MNETKILKNLTKKAKFLLLYDIILVMILFVLIIFAYINPNFYNYKNNDDYILSIDSNIVVDQNNALDINQDANIVEPPLEIVYAGEPNDCGNNFECFKRYSGDCNSNSRFVYTDKIETEDKVFTRVTEYKIEGIEYIYCKVNLSVFDVNVEYKDNYINTLKEEGMDDANISTTLKNESNLIKEDIGKSGYCYYDTPQALIDYLNKLETNTFSGGVSCSLLEDGSPTCTSFGDMVPNACGGNYFFIDYK